MNENSNFEVVVHGDKDTHHRGGIRRNSLGKVAADYEDLHKIKILEKISEKWHQKPISYNSALRAEFLAAEICLLNLARISKKAAEKIRREDIQGAYVDIRWLRSFHEIMRAIGRAVYSLSLNHQPATGAGKTHGLSYLSIADSLSVPLYIESSQLLEKCIALAISDQSEESMKALIGERSHDDPMYALVHCLRLSAHDATKWEADLYRVPVEEGISSYRDVVPHALVYEAVYSADLDVDSYYGEFVAAHQIPEVLCVTANDFLEEGIRQLRQDNLSAATEMVDIVNTLFRVTLASQWSLAECLSPSEYYHFRENLGVASGTHSLALYQHMFKDLYACLWKDVETWLEKDGDVYTVCRQAVGERHASHDAWLKHIFLRNVLILHQLHQEWRHLHLHLPRNILGSGGTKSKIGMPDALETVYALRESANSATPLKRLYSAKNLHLESAAVGAPIASHHAAAESFDAKWNALTGVVARERFPEVQGYGRCPFKKHPRRKP